MKMIAIGTLQARETVRARDRLNPRDRGVYKDVMIAPGKEFDTEKIGMKDDEVQDLIRRGVAERKTKQVADDGDAGAAAGAKPGDAGANAKRT